MSVIFYRSEITTNESFWNSINILITKPNVVNKRLWGSKILFRDIFTLLPPHDFTHNYCRLNDTCDVEDYRKRLYNKLNPTSHSESSLLNSDVILVELLPKNFKESHAFQLVILDKDSTTATFYDATPKSVNQKVSPVFPFSLQFRNNEVVLKAKCESSCKSYQWLKDSVVPQCIKWAEENLHQGPQHICNDSLALVCKDKYYRRYNELKLKYGIDMVKIWPESTDPAKFVFEDVAIATYILLLWESEREYCKKTNRQTFVDLGCGNGLLVYILTKEGHQGVGIDVRKRQIWDMYSEDIKLQEKTIRPSDSYLFPDTDWLIGNHSDELTPWIPVIAARSSYQCNFFLLPCCAFNFDGSKYQRQNSSISQYSEYLQYIKQLSEECGFITDTDRLKIPSTKRICLIGKGRTYSETEYAKYCARIQNIINEPVSKGTCSENLDNQNQWVKDFKARGAVERVRNCTQLDKTLIESIVNIISSYLLEDCNKSVWSIGKTADLNEVVQLISPDKLKALKSECGGLQTLLKNNHHIFKVQSGKVQLRYPKTINEVNIASKSNKNKQNHVKLKQKPCWFHNNHPQGCPLLDSDCSFLHIKC